MNFLPPKLKKIIKKIIKRIIRLYKSVKRKVKKQLKLSIKQKKATKKIFERVRLFIKHKIVNVSSLLNKLISTLKSTLKFLAKYIVLLAVIIKNLIRKSLGIFTKAKQAIKFLMRYISLFVVFLKKAVFKSLKGLTQIKSAVNFIAQSALSIKSKFFSTSVIRKKNKQIINIFLAFFLRFGAFMKCRAFSTLMLCIKLKKALKSLSKSIIRLGSSMKRGVFLILPSPAQRKYAAKKLKEHGLLLSGVVSCGILSALMLSISHKKHEPVLVKGEFQQDDHLGIQAMDSGEKALSTVLGFTNESTSMLSDVAVSSSEATESLEPSESVLIESNKLASPISVRAVGVNPIMQKDLTAADKTSQKEPTKDQSENVQYKEATAELNSNVQIGGNYTYLNLKPEGSPSFGGSLGGMQGSYEYRPKTGFYTGANFAWKEGVTSDSSGDRSILYIDTQERFGYTLAFNNTNCLLTLYSGLGYRHLWQKVSPNSGSSLQFRYNEFYIPVGLSTEYALWSWFTFGLGFTWMPQVFSTVGISAINGTCWDLTNTLSNLCVEVPFDFTLTKSKKFHIIAKSFYEYWEDGHTTATTASGIPLGLPGNTYNYWGLNLNFSYNF